MKERRTPRLADQSPAYKLFHYPYMWIYADNENYDENDTEYFGRLSTGNDQTDMALATVQTERYRTPAEAADLIGRGIGVSLADPKDAIVIYGLICDHLRTWQKYLERGASLKRQRDVPIEGLREFNTLARQLVVVGRRHGLVDSLDPYAESRKRRTHSLGYVAPRDLTQAQHSDDSLNRIVELTRRTKSKGFEDGSGWFR